MSVERIYLEELAKARTYKDLTDKEGDLLDLLTYAGRHKRQILALVLEVPDRTLREMIESLRLKGYPICSSSDASAGGGYWLAKDKEEWTDFIYRELRSRQKTINRLLSRALETSRTYPWEV